MKSILQIQLTIALLGTIISLCQIPMNASQSLKCGRIYTSTVACYRTHVRHLYACTKPKTCTTNADATSPACATCSGAVVSCTTMEEGFSFLHGTTRFRNVVLYRPTCTVSYLTSCLTSFGISDNSHVPFKRKSYLPFKGLRLDCGLTLSYRIRSLLQISSGQTLNLGINNSLGQQRRYFWKGSGQEGSGEDGQDGNDSTDSSSDGNVGDGNDDYQGRGNDGRQGGGDEPPGYPPSSAMPMVSLAPMTVPEVFTPLPVIAVQRNPVFPKFIKIIEVQSVQCSLTSVKFLPP